MGEIYGKMINRDNSLLLRIAIADAVAAGAEYLKLRDQRDLGVQQEVLQFRDYVRHPRHEQGYGAYTDDAEMSIGNAQALLWSSYPNREDFVSAWLREFDFGGRRKGYARGFQAFLESVQGPRDFLSRIRSDSAKNGAIMRAPVIGVLRYPVDVAYIARRQAQITHHTDEGVFSAQVGALAAHYALYTNGPLADVGKFCARYAVRELCERFGHVFSDPWPDNKPVQTYRDQSVGIATVHAVLHLVRTSSSLMEALRRAIELGGDTDSVAAVTWGIVSPRFQNEELPPWMESALEGGNPRTGAPRLLRLGKELMDKYEYPS